MAKGKAQGAKPERGPGREEEDRARLLRRMRNTIEDEEGSSEGEDLDGGPSCAKRKPKQSRSMKPGAAGQGAKAVPSGSRGKGHAALQQGIPGKNQAQAAGSDDEPFSDDDSGAESLPSEEGYLGRAISKGKQQQPRRLLGSSTMRLAASNAAGIGSSGRKGAIADVSDAEGDSGSDPDELGVPERGEEESEDGTEDGSSSSGSDLEDDGRTLGDQVADIPFEALNRIKADGTGLAGQAARRVAKAAAQHKFSRVNKDRPQETSSKRPVGRFREVIQVPNRTARDPRFLEGSVPKGLREAESEAARKRYAFVYDDLLPGERTALQDKLKKEKNPKYRARIQAQMARLDVTLSTEQVARRRDTLEQDWKSKERAAVAGGKTPYYLKAGDKRKLDLLAKYQVLQEGGKLDKFMAKRARKNASKDHRYLPSMRRAQED